MDYSTIISGVIGLLGGGGIVGLYTIRQTKKSKELDNESKELDNAEKLIKQYQELLETYKVERDQAIEQAREEREQARMEREKDAIEREKLRDELNEVKRQLSILQNNLAISNDAVMCAEYFRCNVRNCPNRDPKRDENHIPTLSLKISDEESEDSSM